MLTIEYKSFLLESYFRNGVKLENGEWSYSVQTCFEEFRGRFPGKLKKRTPEVVEEMRGFMETTPKSIRKLPHKIQLSYGTSHSILKMTLRCFRISVYYVNNILTPFVNYLYDDELTNRYLQRDNATAHTANETMLYLRHNFTMIEFIPRSPFLTALDFFLFCYLKNSVYEGRSQNLEDLQNAIIRKLEDIISDR
ncbi:hypothetical protein BDFB_009393, partial [Asbolus verrucosus]